MTAWFLAAAAAFAAGDYAGILTPRFNLWYCVLAAVLAVLLAGLVYFKRAGRSVAACGMALFCACGLAVGSNAMQADDAAIANYTGRQVTLYGKADLLSVKQREDGVSFVLDCTAVKAGGKVRPANGNVRVFASGRVAQAFGSSGVTVSGTLKPLHGFANPGSFDSEAWNL